MRVTLLSEVPDGDHSFSHPSLLNKHLDWSPVRMLATSLCVLWFGDHSFVVSVLLRFCSYSHPKPFSPTPLYTLFSSLSLLLLKPQALGVSGESAEIRDRH